MVYSVIHRTPAQKNREIYMSRMYTQNYCRFLLGINLFTVFFVCPKPYLFKVFEELEEHIPHVEFTHVPTPVIHLKNTGSFMRMEHLYCKQDARVGELFGGNKVRKLEFLLGDALRKKAKHIITVGLVGSNHAAATAVYSHHVGLPCTLVLAPQAVTSYTKRNLLIDYAYGATLYHTQNYKERANKVLELIKYYTEHDGTEPYVIPAGGATPYGALGFVNAVYELKEQIERHELPEPDIIVAPLGTAGTVAGLLLGIRMCNLKTKVLAVSIDKSSVTELKEHINVIFRNTNSLLSGYSSQIPKFELSDNDYSIDTDHAGSYYAQVTHDAADAIELLSSTEGVKLDGTYAGKAFAALMHQAKQDHALTKKVVLFWNTFSSGEVKLPEHKNGIDYHELPLGFHAYFEASVEARDRGY